MRSQLEVTLDRQMCLCRLPVFETEYRFDDRPKARKWRFDFAWPSLKIAVEVEGGTWSNGRHTRGAGYIADAQKYNEAVLQGWHVLRFTGEAIKSGEAVTQIERLIQQKRGR